MGRVVLSARVSQRRLNIQAHLRFLGQRNDVADLLDASDLVVVPSQTEGFPLAVVEALAIGRPVVGYDVGGIGEAVDRGQTGELVPARDMEAFVDAVVSLLDDRAALAAYSKRAFAAAEEFSIGSHVEDCSSATEKSELLPCGLPQQGSGRPACVRASQSRRVCSHAHATSHARVYVDGGRCLTVAERLEYGRGLLTGP